MNVCAIFKFTGVITTAVCRDEKRSRSWYDPLGKICMQSRRSSPITALNSSCNL